MGKIKDMVTRQSEEPTNVAFFTGYDRTRGFDNNPLIDAADDGSHAEDAAKPEVQAQATRPRKPRSQPRAKIRPASAEPALPVGDLVTGMDLNDPAHVAELAARYTSMNDSMKRLAQEKALLVDNLDQADAAVSKAEAALAELQRQHNELGRELAHAKEKLEIATKSSGAIFERTVFSILKWGGIGSVLIFASAFFYF
ncbi:hypothetical protein [Paracoccus sp. T5]|uniref:hypothetical protein n=1 Tax=Paracoccus sp. T5 TaxID=3402161 RepID=UPI003AE96C52